MASNSSRRIAAAAVRGARTFSFCSFALPLSARDLTPTTAGSRCSGPAPGPASFYAALLVTSTGRRYSSAATPAELSQPRSRRSAAESSDAACANNNATEDASASANPEVKAAGASLSASGQVGEAPLVEEAVSSEVAAAESGDSAKARFPKRSVAILLGYSGKGYRGMQVHKDGAFATIEGELLRALTEIGSLTDTNAADPHKVSLRRASRTDKGVHAAENVVALKAGIGIPGFMMKLNAALPPTIRAYGYSLAMRGFDPRRDVSSRKYEYLLPTYVLEHSAKPEFLQRSISWEDSPDGFPRLLYIPTPEEVEEVNRHRLAPEKLEMARDLAKSFPGFRNFHNYTKSKLFADPSARRKLMTFTISDPFVRATEHGESMEWVSLKLHGCSFMLHQIRKMIAMIIIGVRANADPSIIKKTFGKKHLNIPKCPAYGLLLERPILDDYNRAVEKQNRRTFEFELHAEKARRFKEEVIYDEIVSCEATEHPWLGWLVSTKLHRETFIPYMLGELTSPALEALHIGPADSPDGSAVDAKLAGREAADAFYSAYRDLGSIAGKEIAEGAM